MIALTSTRARAEEWIALIRGPGESIKNFNCFSILVISIGYPRTGVNQMRIRFQCEGFHCGYGQSSIVSIDLDGMGILLGVL